ncbi:MAG: tape measure protein [Clostridium sp.]|nr:tape measure protein [Clostridium sp.]
MARDISIAISAKDNFTDSLKKMQGMQTTFRKDLGQLNDELNKMNKNKVELKVDMTKAKNELKDAEKSFKKLGDEANRNKLIMSQTKYDTVKKNFDLVSQGAKQAERDIRNLTDTMTKSEGKGKALSNTLPTGSPSTASTLAQAGLLSMINNSASNLLSTGVSSFFSDSMGSAIGSIAGGAATGAAIGSIIPGVGTAIGAAVGTVAGGINAITQNFNEKDDAFKSVVQSNYELAKELQANSLENGKTIAGGREQDKISFSTLLGGEDVAEEFLKEINNFGAVTPFEYDTLTTMAKTMLAYGYKMEEIVPELTKIGDGGSALGIKEDDLNNIVTYLGRMKSTGKATLEYINPILERGIPVFDFLANSLGVSSQQAQEMLNKGLIPGAEAAQIISDAMGTTYAGNMEKQSQTYEGLLSTLEDMQNEMDNAMGEAYNNKRKEGLNAQIEWLGSDSASKMQEANAMIGEWKASLDNEHDAAIREAMDSMMASAEYKTAEMEGDKVKMGELLAKAQVEGENNYKATAGYQEQLASDLALIGSIRENTALRSEYYSTGYTMGQEFSKGLAAGKQINFNTSSSGIPNYVTGNNTSNSGVGSSYLRGGYAYGLNSVPYDNFPALLHQGERVLTASQARQQDSKTPVQVNISQMVVREEQDINKVANIIVSELYKASINFGGEH